MKKAFNIGWISRGQRFGPGYRAKSSRVTWLAIRSVLCAERTMATRSWSGLSNAISLRAG